MKTQTAKISPIAHLAQNIYLALAGLILLGIFTQGFLIGTTIFAGSASGRQAHGALGMILVLLILLLAITSLLTILPGLIKGVSWLLLALAIIQVVLPSLGSIAGAFHPANATLLFGVNVFLIFRAWQFTRTK